ncbi:hypothetical protein J26TS2_00190 [Shouchella clausii]|nr:hypothetical protein J26TS2_00190 [Shouchella clausii]
MTSINNYDKSGVLGGNYDSCVMDFEAAHQALLAEARNAGYREGFEAGRKVEREAFDVAEGVAESFTVGDQQAKEYVESAIKETREFNQQARRDEIVEQAIEDVGAFLIRGTDDFPTFMFEVEFIVNKEKRTVVALIKGRNSRYVYVRGIAKCTPGDCFNVHIGKAIALRRALGLPVPDEYLNAPQPSEVRVGDVIGYPFDIHDNQRLTVEEIADEIAYVDNGGFFRTEHLFDRLKCDPRFDPYIIDDSRE